MRSILNLIGGRLLTRQRQARWLLEANIGRAIGAYHRQLNAGSESNTNRQIPQGVKTVGWQRDGGKCAECGATDYLEADHIIPHKIGGRIPSRMFNFCAAAVQSEARRRGLRSRPDS